MKKYHLYLWIIALAGLMTACSQDEAAGPQNEASNRVRIGAAVNQALQTRAASVTIPEGHKLRYVLEVWNTAESAACIYREEKTATRAAAVAFDFTLSEAGNYKALLWADFVLANASGTPKSSPNNYTHYADLHYATDGSIGLRKVVLAKTGEYYVLNDDARDAFFACIPIKKGTDAFEQEVELTRPLGQINVIEKNTGLLTNVESIKLDYDVPDYFNVETGETTGIATVKPKVSTLPTATAVRKANLFYDFIFAPATGQTTLGEIKMEFTSISPSITLPEYTIPGNMPVVRNKRTNISGYILQANSNAARLTVTVSDKWTTPDEEKDLEVGAYYYDDDTWSITYNANKTCIGIVYEVNADRKSGKIVGMAQLSSLKWSTEQIETGATSTTDGRANMATISDLIANSGSSKSWDTYPVFKWVTEQNGNDGNWNATNDKWYLPAKDELDALCTVVDTYGQDNFNDKITTAGGTAISKYFYASSTEVSDTDFWYTSFNNGATSSLSKTMNFAVRCIRKF